MKFLYFISGWEGSTADATMYAHSQLVDLTIPPGKFYLADAGFGICDSLLVPYRGVRYHLAEWGRANVRYAANIQYLQQLNCINQACKLRGIVQSTTCICQKCG